MYNKYNNKYLKNIQQQETKNIDNNTSTSNNNSNIPSKNGSNLRDNNNNNLLLPSTSEIRSRIKVVKTVLSMVLILLSGTVVMISSNEILQPAYAITTSM